MKNAFFPIIIKVKTLQGKGIKIIYEAGKHQKPLSQGLLTSRYLDGVPEDSRYYKANTGLKQKLTQEMKVRLIELNFLAQKRGQTLSQMAIAWLLQDKAITSVILGASRPEQVEENVKALENLQFSAQELKEIYILATQKI